MIGYYILAGIIFLVSTYVSNKLKSKFKHYSKVRLQNGMSGKEIAEKMLADNGITDVQVISTPGQLTDHYNPRNKTVNLSDVVYNERNAAAAAVSAHEVGHAVQHAKAYSWLKMRSAIVPAVGISSKLSNIVIMAGLVLSVSGSLLGNTIFLIGIILFAVTTLFAFITLPVEFDASKRALVWLERENMVTQEEHAGAKDALKWAARTYVVAALGSLATLLYFIMIFLNRR
ncbi:zinc metallopeptidase [Patiriisocius hiemis]|uniref:Zinc metallopeptidase n=1 Tax=Patiriisocius hiemis TaxID=3075604 RepID=A0ABU2YDY1_9FLAO|nr:zinc metallopeptidase [Constantimarinum sp. W242]MDT0556399.1 zinc metallopeptidase [Constantimarinum sp. W242]